MLSDYLLAAFSIACALRLHHVATPRHRGIRLWAAAMEFTGFAALLGGSYHGFRGTWAPNMAAAVWTLALAAIGLAAAALFVAAAFAFVSRPVRRLLIVFAAIQLVVYLSWIVGHSEFRYAVYDYGALMAGVLAMAVWGWTRGVHGAVWVVAGIAVSFAAALVQRFAPDVHPHFNHNDAYHLVQAIGVYLFYRGAERLQDRQ